MGKPAFAEKDIDAEIGEALNRIVFTDLATQFTHALHDISKVNIRVAGDMDAVLIRHLHIVHGGRAANEGLAGDAAIIQAVAAH